MDITGRSYMLIFSGSQRVKLCQLLCQKFPKHFADNKLILQYLMFDHDNICDPSAKTI